MKIKDELSSATNLITANTIRCDHLKDTTDETNVSIMDFRREVYSEMRRLWGVINAPGVRKPKLDDMVKKCVLYERASREKNYTIGLNSVRDGSREEDLPDDIAAFSHDYAAWIAYQADHEAIMRVIAGTNPEEYAYIEDDIESRRRALLDR